MWYKIFLNECEIIKENYNIDLFINNSRQEKICIDSIIQNIKDTDILIYQYLDKKHGELSTSNILNIIKKECITIYIPYIWIDGIAHLSFAPFTPIHNYGKIYGEEYIFDLINKGFDKNEIIELFINNNINFDNENRFNNSLKELKKRIITNNSKLEICNFIIKNYKDKKLMLSHNHPTSIIFIKICEYILDILKINYKYNEQLYKENQIKLSDTYFIVHPKQGLSYSNSNYYDEGIKLINIICENHK